MPETTPTLSAEQRAQLKAALDREWPMPTLMDDVAETVARMVADAEQRGRAEVSAAVEAVAEEWERQADVLRGDAACGDIEADWHDRSMRRHITDLRAALTDPAAAVARIKAEALREAADKWQWGEWTVLTAPIKAASQPQRIIGAAQAVTDWLRTRADRIGGDA